jgi:hypothetical protein
MMFCRAVSWHQHEVLVHHADPQPHGLSGAMDPDRRALPADAAAIRRGQTVQDVDQGRLAGAVLAEQGVDLPFQDLELDPVVGDHARVDLGDAVHAQQRA